MHYLHITARIAHGGIRAVSLTTIEFNVHIYMILQANVLVTSGGVVKINISHFSLGVLPETLIFDSQRKANTSWTPPEGLWEVALGNNYPRPTFSGDIYSFAITCIEVMQLPTPL